MSLIVISFHFSDSTKKYALWYANLCNFPRKVTVSSDSVNTYNMKVSIACVELISTRYLSFDK